MNRLNKKIVWAGLASIVVGGALGFLSLSTVTPCRQILEIVAQTPANTDLHVYYDIGQGFNPRHLSVNKMAASDSPSPLCYCLPDQAIRKLRIDPGTPTPNMKITDITLVYRDQPPVAIDLSAVKPLHQIEWLRSNEQGLTFQTTANANDPMLLIDAVPRVVPLSWIKSLLPPFIGGLLGLLMTFCGWAAVRFLHPASSESKK